MTEFLLELYIPRSGRSVVPDGALRVGCARLRGEGVAVRYLRSIFVPEDETCFFVFEAESADNVRQAARLAGLPNQRLVEALAVEAGAL